MGRIEHADASSSSEDSSCTVCGRISDLVELSALYRTPDSRRRKLLSFRLPLASYFAHRQLVALEKALLERRLIRPQQETH